MNLYPQKVHPSCSDLLFLYGWQTLKMSGCPYLKKEQYADANGNFVGTYYVVCTKEVFGKRDDNDW